MIYNNKSTVILLGAWLFDELLESPLILFGSTMVTIGQVFLVGAVLGCKLISNFLV
jgi:hypothetical protein